MYTKEFTKFVFEVKWIELDMPHFYFRKSSFPICSILNSHLLKFEFIYNFTFSALIILGIGSGVSLKVFILEHLFVRFLFKRV